MTELPRETYREAVLALGRLSEEARKVAFPISEEMVVTYTRNASIFFASFRTVAGSPVQQGTRNVVLNWNPLMERWDVLSAIFTADKGAHWSRTGGAKRGLYELDTWTTQPPKFFRVER